MQVDSEDRYIDEHRQAGRPKLPIVLLVIAVVIGIAWYFSGGESEVAAPPPAAPQPAATPPPPEPAVVPDIPESAGEPAVEAAKEPNEPPPPPPPPPLQLADSDPAVREALAEPLSAPQFEQTLRQDNLIQRATAVMDATSRGGLLRKVIALPKPDGDFTVIAVDGETRVDPRSYERYDGYAQAIDAVDTAAIVAAFHRFRPLLEEAYAGLGYKAEDMDNTLIRALDQIIAAPVLEQPAALEKGVATYKYSDESLEKLSPLAKQLMRMGPDNQKLVQAKARELRRALLGK